MLPPFIIEQIRKREEEERRPEHQPVIELPLHVPSLPESRPRDEEKERGVVIIDL